MPIVLGKLIVLKETREMNPPAKAQPTGERSDLSLLRTITHHHQIPCPGSFIRIGGQIAMIGPHQHFQILLRNKPGRSQKIRPGQAPPAIRCACAPTMRHRAPRKVIIVHGIVAEVDALPLHAQLRKIPGMRSSSRQSRTSQPDNTALHGFSQPRPRRIPPRALRHDDRPAAAPAAPQQRRQRIRHRPPRHSHHVRTAPVQFPEHHPERPQPPRGPKLRHRLNGPADETLCPIHMIPSVDVVAFTVLHSRHFHPASRSLQSRVVIRTKPPETDSCLHLS